MNLHIKNNTYSFAEIQQGNFQLEGDDLIDPILLFCFEWLNQTETFSLQSSGSTGTPKEIQILRTQMKSSADATVEFLGLKANDHALVCLNTNYIAGKMMLVRCMEHNINATIVPPCSAPFREHLLPKAFDFIAMAPIQVQFSLDCAGDHPAFLQTKKLIIGGAPITESLEKRIKQELSNTDVYHTYGMTETVSHVALKKIHQQADSFFHTLPNVVIGQDDRKCLWVQGPMSNDVKLQTNDVVRLINDTTFEWLGRADNIINSGGVKVQAEKVEKSINEGLKKIGYQNILMFVGGLPNENLGEEVTIFIEGITLKQTEIDQLLDIVKKPLDKYEVPRNVVSLSNFEKTDTMKIRRKATIQKFIEQQ
ncbi:AMP-binding protein [Flammeovirga sp. MY04]|uniref:AMP-binding protein n=1 Tax=Flammeovirga sp. MY04 TaxID=1191459 RepID=UPI0008063DA3|nr:AMP-binding protein [Flammeovirga sp. MY04]ANQ49498.1 AMP-binding protein [Flammeovirga sp. MY04]